MASLIDLEMLRLVVLAWIFLVNLFHAFVAERSFLFSLKLDIRLWFLGLGMRWRLEAERSFGLLELLPCWTWILGVLGILYSLKCALVSLA